MCPYGYVGYGYLSTCADGFVFWTNHVESRVGVVTPHFGRKSATSSNSSLSSLSLGPLIKRVKTRLSSLIYVRQWSP